MNQRSARAHPCAGKPEVSEGTPLSRRTRIPARAHTRALPLLRRGEGEKNVSKGILPSSPLLRRGQDEKSGQLASPPCRHTGASEGSVPSPQSLWKEPARDEKDPVPPPLTREPSKAGDSRGREAKREAADNAIVGEEGSSPQYMDTPRWVKPNSRKHCTPSLSSCPLGAFQRKSRSSQLTQQRKQTRRRARNSDVSINHLHPRPLFDQPGREGCLRQQHPLCPDIDHVILANPRERALSVPSGLYRRERTRAQPRPRINQRTRRPSRPQT